MNSVVSEKKFIQERLGIPYENLSQSYLRAETLLTNLSTYAFYLQRGQVATPLVTENLLDLNDQFVITQFRIRPCRSLFGKSRIRRCIDGDVLMGDYSDFSDNEDSGGIVLGATGGAPFNSARSEFTREDAGEMNY